MVIHHTHTILDLCKAFNTVLYHVLLIHLDGWMDGWTIR